MCWAVLKDELLSIEQKIKFICQSVSKWEKPFLYWVIISSKYKTDWEEWRNIFFVTTNLKENKWTWKNVFWRPFLTSSWQNCSTRLKRLHNPDTLQTPSNAHQEESNPTGFSFHWSSKTTMGRRRNETEKLWGWGGIWCCYHLGEEPVLLAFDTQPAGLLLR